MSDATQAVALPGMPLPAELCTFQAPDPTDGSVDPTVQPVLSCASPDASSPRFQPLIPTMSGESSPSPGARNEVPHVPLMVRSSIGAQLNATLGLLVPPKSLY